MAEAGAVPGPGGAGGSGAATPRSSVSPTVSFVLDSDPLSESNPGRQLKVPVPRSLPELKQAAGLLFDPQGRSVRMRLFHNGREMHHPMAVEQLKDGDVVLVRLERPMQRVADAVLTTHQADYVRHPPQPSASREGAVAASAVASAMQGRSLEGISAYKSDYVQHGRVERPTRTAQVKYSKHWLSTPRGTDRAESTYQQYFHWCTATPERGVNNAEGSVLGDAAKGLPFTATTSYADHYPKWEAPQKAQASKRDSDSTLSRQARETPFDGSSQYASDFVRHSDDNCRQPSARPDRGAYSYTPFSGCSEYRQQFQQKATKATVVHLALDLEARPRGASVP